MARTEMSDDYIVNGRWHTCGCGTRYSDSDGGCGNCAEMTDEEREEAHANRISAEDGRIDALIEAREERLDRDNERW